MNEKTINTLEFPKVRERLASHASFSAGKELALQLAPHTDINQVRRAQRITTEAVRLLALRPDVTIGGARDVREAVRRAELGSILDPTLILTVLDTLRAGRNLRNLINRTQEQKGEIDTLDAIADAIVLMPKVEAEIERCINDEGHVLDSASPALGKIRISIRAAHNRLITRLQQIISSGAYSRAIQEPIITLRDGRYVVPVKRDFQGVLKGIVHDQSNSGATLFVEPLAIVDLGNAWRQLQLEETEEIERIMRELGALIGAQGISIRTNVEIIAELDLALAKAHYSLAINGREPELVASSQLPVVGDDGRKLKDERRNTGNRQPATVPHNGLLLKNARHPLLRGHVVPITVELGERFGILVITGPNTGGKTVALKTVGLLTLMAQAGLHIPIDEGSRVVVFKKVFADIGDEQSIEQSLSTFSSHMRNIIGILKETDRESLVLLDELGAGTDPQEGSALARAIIGFLLDMGTMSVCTTHYSELKAFAFNTPGVENASVEFNVETLSPTYRLMIGVPGRSNAFAIANRLGLSHTLIDRAKRFIDPHTQRVEDLLEDIRSERETARSERGTAEQERLEIADRRRELDRQLAEIDEIKRQAAEEARAGFEHEVEELRSDLRRLRGRVEAGLAATSEDVMTRQELQQAQARAEEFERQLRVKRREKGSESRRKTGDGGRRKTNGVEAAEAHVIGTGDTVYVVSLGTEGEVLGPPDNGGQVEVQVGAFKTRAPLSGVALRRTAQSNRRSESVSAGVAGKYTAVAPTEVPPLEYDFRGWRPEEAIEEMDRRLSDAAIVGMPFLRIIHGKGTGALRKALRDFFKTHPVVKDVETAPVEQGGEGVTIVRL